MTRLNGKYVRKDVTVLPGGSMVVDWMVADAKGNFGRPVSSEGGCRTFHKKGEDVPALPYRMVKLNA